MMKVNDLLEIIKSSKHGTDFWIFTSGYNLTMENAIKLSECQWDEPGYHPPGGGRKSLGVWQMALPAAARDSRRPRGGENPDGPTPNFMGKPRASWIWR